LSCTVRRWDRFGFLVHHPEVASVEGGCVAPWTGMVPIGRLTSNEATDASHSLDSRSGRRAKRLAGRRLRASAGGLAFKSPRLSSARLVIRRGCFKKQPPAFRVGYFVPTFVIARRNVAVATLLVMARSLRMTLERRKTAGLDDKLTTASELEKLMSEVMCYERKWLKRNLSRHTMRHQLDATNHGRQSSPATTPSGFP
jgi:hypothetical protein